jgi:hypothetical protein
MVQCELSESAVILVKVVLVNKLVEVIVTAGAAVGG